MPKPVAGKITAVLSVSQFDGADELPVIQERREVLLHDGDDPEQVIDDALTEIFDKYTMVPNDPEATDGG